MEQETNQFLGEEHIGKLMVTALSAIWYILHMKLVKPRGADFKMEGG